MSYWVFIVVMRVWGKTIRVVAQIAINSLSSSYIHIKRPKIIKCMFFNYQKENIAIHVIQMLSVFWIPRPRPKWFKDIVFQPLALIEKYNKSTFWKDFFSWNTLRSFVRTLRLSQRGRMAYTTLTPTLSVLSKFTE